MYYSEIHAGIGWFWNGGIDISVGGVELSGNVKTVAEILPSLQNAIAELYPDSKYNAERLCRTFVPTWFGPEEYRAR